MKTTVVAVASALIFSVTVPARAQKDHGMHDQRPSASAAEQAMTDGEIRKVDKDAQKITIRHGPMPALDMPSAMTMVYRVADPAMLEKVKAGDKVRFEAEKVGSVFTVTKIEPAR